MTKCSWPSHSAHAWSLRPEIDASASMLVGQAPCPSMLKAHHAFACRTMSVPWALFGLGATSDLSPQCASKRHRRERHRPVQRGEIEQGARWQWLRKAASVGGLFYPSLAAAFLTRSRIDFAARLHRLHYNGIASAIACRTFRLGRLRGWLFHLKPPRPPRWWPISV
jgi:hypothetical protein